jgi:hypothetical protein
MQRSRAGGGTGAPIAMGAASMRVGREATRPGEEWVPVESGTSEEESDQVQVKGWSPVIPTKGCHQKVSAISDPPSGHVPGGPSLGRRSGPGRTSFAPVGSSPGQAGSPSPFPITDRVPVDLPSRNIDKAGSALAHRNQRMSPISRKDRGSELPLGRPYLDALESRPHRNQSDGGSSDASYPPALATGAV